MARSLFLAVLLVGLAVCAVGTADLEIGEGVEIDADLLDAGAGDAQQGDALAQEAPPWMRLPLRIRGSVPEHVWAEEVGGASEAERVLQFRRLVAREARGGRPFVVRGAGTLVRSQLSLTSVRALDRYDVPVRVQQASTWLFRYHSPIAENRTATVPGLANQYFYSEPMYTWQRMAPADVWRRCSQARAEFLYYSGSWERRKNAEAYAGLGNVDMFRLAGKPGQDHDEAATAADPTVSLWVGCRGVTASMHYDDQDNLVYAVAGRKRFLLAEPSSARDVHMYPFVGESLRQTQVPMDADLDEMRARFPRFVRRFVDVPQSASAGHGDDGGGVLEAVLEAGDVLYMPARWFHAVTSLDAAVSLTFHTPAPYSRVYDEVRASTDVRAGPHRGRHLQLVARRLLVLLAAALPVRTTMPHDEDDDGNNDVASVLVAATDEWPGEQGLLSMSTVSSVAAGSVARLHLRELLDERYPRHAFAWATATTMAGEDRGQRQDSPPGGRAVLPRLECRHDVALFRMLGWPAASVQTTTSDLCALAPGSLRPGDDAAALDARLRGTVAAIAREWRHDALKTTLRIEAFNLLEGLAWQAVRRADDDDDVIGAADGGTGVGGQRGAPAVPYFLRAVACMCT